jgi:hypothetical protein
MSYYSQSQQIDTNAITLKSLTSTDVDINCLTGNVRINGIVPGAGGGGGGGGPYDGPGNIRLNTGNFIAEGDGVATGLMTGQTIASVGKVTAGGNLETNANIEIKTNGNLTLDGNGSILQLGGGKITSGSGGIESLGDIKTIGAFDLEIGKDIYFDGTDIYHRTNNPAAQKSYKDYKQLPGLNDANKFTGANQFNSNTTEFAAKVSVGTRDPQSLLFTQNLALNTSGNIESKTINNGTLIQCGNINCGNAGENEVRARVFKTRTNEHSSPEGWTIEQQLPSNPAVPFDRSLTFKGGEANAFISIIDNAPGVIPNIVLDPRTSVLGGLISATTYQVGQSIEGFLIEQPNTGGDTNNLLIKAGSNEGVVKFQNNAGTINLAIIQKDPVTNQGRIYCPAIFFGTTGVHNSIVNDTSGPDSLVLKIRQATSSSKVEFLDDEDASIMEVKKTEIELGPTIPITFGAYNFRPQQYYRDITAFSFNHSALGATNQIFTTNSSDWVNVNTGATNQTISMGNVSNRGAYKLTLRQTTAGTLGQINDLRLMSDIVLTRANDNDPDIILPSPTVYSFDSYDGQGQAPIITMSPGSFVYNVYATFPQTSGNETANVRITLTQMPYFA